MINRLCIVLAHGGASETVKRHLPVWESLHDRVILCAPADDPLNLPNKWVFLYGKSSKYAADTNLRARAAMDLACVIEPEFLTVCEYDALLWNWPSKLIEEIAKPEVFIAGRAFGSVFRSDDPKFKGQYYVHSPIIFDRDGYRETTIAMHDLPDDAELGFGDRYFGYSITEAGVSLFNGHDYGLSYSQNHIQAQHLLEATTTIRAGACFTHGVKDDAVFQTLLNSAKIAVDPR